MAIVRYIFYLGWDPKYASFIYGIVAIFSIMNLYLFLRHTVRPRIWAHYGFDMCGVCYLLCNDMHIYRSDKRRCKCKQQRAKSLCLVEIYTTLINKFDSPV